MNNVSSFSTPIQGYRIFNRIVHVKRDDLLKIHEISGNKVRKFQHIINRIESASMPSRIVSFGGAQSNAMLALANLAATSVETCEFQYFTRKLPIHLKTNPVGNMNKALKKGMKMIELPSEDYDSLAMLPSTATASEVPESVRRHLSSSFDVDFCDVFWVPQGGCMQECSIGVAMLMEEIAEQIHSIENDFARNEKNRPWKIVFASGTGTTSLFAAKALDQWLAKTQHISNRNMQIVAASCVAPTADFLTMLATIKQDQCLACREPVVLRTPSDPDNERYRFGNLSNSLFRIWTDICAQTNIEFDLLYAPRAFQLLLGSEIWRDASTNILYYHCGGVEGNDSMLQRYHRQANLISKPSSAE